jgi:hypothetical protein
MPRGIHLNQTQKQQIYVGITKGHDDATIIESVFVADDISPTYFLRSFGPGESQDFQSVRSNWIIKGMRTFIASSNFPS